MNPLSSGRDLRERPGAKRMEAPLIDRRDFLKAGATAAVSTALCMPAIRTARAATQLTFFTPFGFSPDYIEIMNAKSGGHFARAGLDVTVRGAQGTAQAMQQLITGEAHIIRAAPIDQMRLVQTQNLPLTAISTLYQSSNFYLISSKDKPITRAEDLKGKTIGVVSVAGTTSIYLDIMLKKGGLTKDDVKRQTTGNGPGAFQLVKQGRIDGFIATHVATIPLERAGEQITYFSSDKYSPMPNQGYLTTRGFAEKNPEAAVAFIKAVKASVEEILTQPHRPIFERAAKEFEIQGIRDMDNILAISKNWPSLLLSQGRENLLRNVPELWTSGVDVLADVGFLKPTAATDFYTNEYFDKAVKV
ncbi:MAG: myristoyl transferase [Hyphomicrobiales bacterium]|nr:myristoyl transferase [Hyphomicrobiales bacterium]